MGDSANSLCQNHKKCMKDSMENMPIDNQGVYV